MRIRVLLQTLILARMFVAQALLLPTRSSLVRSRIQTRLFASVGAPQQTPVASDKLSSIILTQGVVRPGYGRGSKTLGFPTANLPDFDAELREHGVERGIYYGWASIAGEKEFFPCVSNIGISPTFVGEENSGNIVEAYVLERPRGRGDFYGSLLRLALVGYIRPEVKFNNIGELVRRIKEDVAFTKQACALASATGSNSVVEGGDVQAARMRLLYAHSVRPFLETTDNTFQYSTAAVGSQQSELSLESSAIQSARQRNQKAVSDSPSVQADNPQFLCAINIDAILSKLHAAH